MSVPTATQCASVKLVLDTNVVLDWLLFEHLSVQPLRDGIRDGRVVVMTYPGAIAELRRVLGYRQFELDEARQTGILASYREQTRLVPPAEQDLIDCGELPRGFPMCRDPEDNHFLALAYHAKATALVSKDRRVLKCRRRALAFGFTIVNVVQAAEHVSLVRG